MVDSIRPYGTDTIGVYGGYPTGFADPIKSRTDFEQPHLRDTLKVASPTDNAPLRYSSCDAPKLQTPETLSPSEIMDSVMALLSAFSHELMVDKQQEFSKANDMRMEERNAQAEEFNKALEKASKATGWSKVETVVQTSSAVIALAAVGTTTLGVGLAVVFAVSITYNVANLLSDGKYTEKAVSFIGNKTGLSKEGTENLRLGVSLGASGATIVASLVTTNIGGTITSIMGMAQIPLTGMRGYNDVMGSVHKERSSLHEKKADENDHFITEALSRSEELLENDHMLKVSCNNFNKSRMALFQEIIQ